MAMKKETIILLMLSVFLCFAVTGCSNESIFHKDTASGLAEMLPENIISIEVSGFYNGGDLQAWELGQDEIEELTAWVTELSLKHCLFDEGKAPNEYWCGGVSYTFDINNGELSFTWIYIDKAYVRYHGEWYEIISSSEPPLGLDF